MSEYLCQFFGFYLGIWHLPILFHTTTCRLLSHATTFTTQKIITIFTYKSHFLLTLFLPVTVPGNERSTIFVSAGNNIYIYIYFKGKHMVWDWHL